MTVSADSMLGNSPTELDGLFRDGQSGPIPQGRMAGTVILFSGGRAARPLARALGLIFWKGKDFHEPTHDLKNLISPLAFPAIRAEVYGADSWVDERPCVVLDYSKSSKVAGWIRDEIREVSPGVYLGVVWGVGRLFGGRRMIARFALTAPAH